MNELQKLIYTERYRPQTLDELVLKDDAKLLFKNCKKNPSLIPSFIFYSSKPGTGKTSTAKILINYFGCDSLIINASDERGIDTIRDKINLFVKSMSSNDFKRCVFMDEADGLGNIAMDSLKNLMETYSDNCFFIFSANDLSKIIEPIRSRCTVINFETPDSEIIFDRLKYICNQEKLQCTDDNLYDVVNTYYPDIRAMVNFLQISFFTNATITNPTEQFEKFYEQIRNRNAGKIYEVVYSGQLNIPAFNKWFFHKLFDNCEKLGYNVCRDVGLLLAENEKSFSLGYNHEIIFITSCLKIGDILNGIV